MSHTEEELTRLIEWAELQIKSQAKMQDDKKTTDAMFAQREEGIAQWMLAIQLAQAELSRREGEKAKAVDWKHVANEWADMATNGIQWLRNIEAGVSTVDVALEAMAVDHAHCLVVATEAFNAEREPAKQAQCVCSFKDVNQRCCGEFNNKGTGVDVCLVILQGGYRCGHKRACHIKKR